MRQLLLCLYFLAATLAINAQQPNTPIQGWKMQEENGVYNFTPAMLFGAPNFRYEVYPPQKGSSENIDSWLAAVAEKDIKAGGYTIVPGQTKANDIKSFKLFTAVVKDAANKNWIVNYMAYALPDHSVRFCRITELPNTATGKANMNTAVAHFMKLSKHEGGYNDGGMAGSGQTGTSQTSGSSSRPSAYHKVETPTTAPGQGLKPSEFKEILHQEYSTGVGGIMIIEYNPYYLLNDGTIYDVTNVSAYDLDVAKSRQVEPKKWGTWKQEGNTLIVMFSRDKKPDRWEGKQKWFYAKPAPKGTRIAGTWSTIGGGGNTAMGGGTMVVFSGSYTFNDKGQFTTQSTGGGTFNGGDLGTTTAYSNKNGAGTYEFDGYCLTLHFLNGTVVRKNFCFYDDTKEVWVFGGSAYTPSDATEKKFKKANR